MALNPTLLALAKKRIWEDLRHEKMAVVGPGGMPPMDPAMMGGGGGPPMDPAMMGGAPPMDPAAMGGAPPMDPAMMGGAPAPPPDASGAAMMGGSPSDPAATAGAAAQQKMKPEQMMQMLDFRLYNMQQQLTAVMNALNVQLDPGALVTPPGSPTPVAEAAIPGGPQDPNQGKGGGGEQSAISAIEPIQGAAPEMAGGAPKMAAARTNPLPAVGQPYKGPTANWWKNAPVADSAAAVAAMLRARANRQ